MVCKVIGLKYAINNIMEGWYKIDRKLLEHPLWLCEPFTRGQAWVDLIGLASHEHKFFYIRNVKVTIERGQVGWSEPKLASRWRWSRTKLRKFLNDLEKEQQVIQQKNNVTQIVTIVNYEEYQGKEQQDIQQKNSKKTAERRIQEVDTNVSTEKNKRTNTFVPPTLQEVVQFFKEKGFDEHLAARAWSSYDANNWLDSKNQKIVNWKMKMIQVWFREENRIKPTVNPHAAAPR